jgi:hypothetical protein
MNVLNGLAGYFLFLNKHSLLVLAQIHFSAALAYESYTGMADVFKGTY